MRSRSSALPSSCRTVCVPERLPETLREGGIRTPHSFAESKHVGVARKIREGSSPARARMGDGEWPPSTWPEGPRPKGRTERSWMQREQSSRVRCPETPETRAPSRWPLWPRLRLRDAGTTWRGDGWNNGPLYCNIPSLKNGSRRTSSVAVAPGIGRKESTVARRASRWEGR